jgi:hypothetical protein
MVMAHLHRWVKVHLHLRSESGYDCVTPRHVGIVTKEHAIVVEDHLNRTAQMYEKYLKNTTTHSTTLPTYGKMNSVKDRLVLNIANEPADVVSILLQVRLPCSKVELCLFLLGIVNPVNIVCLFIWET